MCPLPLKPITEKSQETIESSGLIINQEKRIESKIRFKVEFNRQYPEDIKGEISVLDKSEYTNKELYSILNDEPFWITFESHWGERAIYIKPNYLVALSLQDFIRVSIKEIYLVSREEIKGMQRHNYLEFESNKPHGVVSHVMKPFKLQGTFFDPILHFKRGIIINYDFEWRKGFEEGNWSDKNWVINLGSKVIINPTMNFLEQEYFDTKAYTALPEIDFESRLKSLDIKISDEQVIRFFNKKFKDQDIIEKAISFTTGKRTFSHFSGLYYYWPSKRVYLEVKRYKSIVNRKTLHISRTQLYTGGWELIRDASEKIYLESSEKKQRIIRSIDRYVESFEAPYLEVKLVLLHSALSILLDQTKYREMGLAQEEVPNDIPIKPIRSAGALPKTVAAFMIKNNVKWSDLSKDPDNENLDEFNELRNQYLKQLDHKIEDIKPIDTLCTLFERILLIELGLNPRDYPVIE